MKKLNSKSQKGRSMVEMLGVLAIIGVLSVGGIAGYTSAMNKHRANELLYQVNLRANTCMAQIQSGNAPYIADFGNYDGYSFAVAANPTNANQFQITITGTISEAVCKSMKNTVGDATPVRNISENCSVVTFNNDMGATDVIPTCDNGKAWNGSECVPVAQLYIDASEGSYDCPSGTYQPSSNEVFRDCNCVEMGEDWPDHYSCTCHFWGCLRDGRYMSGGVITAPLQGGCSSEPACRRYAAGEPIPTCNDGKAWNGSECVPVAQLYISEVSGACPNGTHQASSSDILRDCNCEDAGGVFSCTPRCENISGCLTNGDYMSAGALVPHEIIGDGCVGATDSMVCRY